MKTVNYSSLDCKNRDSSLGVHEIRIPYPNWLGKAPNPLVTAKDIPAVNVACPHCKHVYEYTPDNLHWNLSQIPDQDSIQDEPVSFAVEFVCDEPDCKALVLMHTMRDASENKKSVLERLRQSVFHVFCMNDHILHFPMDDRSIVRAEDEAPF